MELFGTNFCITLGSWRLKLNVALEDIDAPQSAKEATPHRVRIVPEGGYQHREA